MQQSTYEEAILQKVDEFLEVSRTNTSQREVDQHSTELNILSKDPSFINTVHKLLLTPNVFSKGKKDKQILLTSLLKDKFKFQYEILAKNIQSHYIQLIQIANSLYVPYSLIQLSVYATYTNISLALAYTYLHLLATNAPKIQDFLAPLIPKDQQHLKLYNFYFKTLEYIATQIDNPKFVIDQLQRDIAHQKLIEMQLTILQGFQNVSTGVFEVESMNKENILYCFQAWITVYNNPDVLNSLPNHSLFVKVFNYILDEECGEAAGNCLRSVIYQLKTQQENRPMFQLLSNYSLKIIELIDQYAGSSEYDKAQDFVRIVSDFARKSRKLFVAKYDRTIDAFLRKLIVYLGDDLMNTYQSVADVFEGIIKEIQSVQKQGKTVHPDIFLLIDPLYDQLCHKCSFPHRLIKELNHTDESKAHHISSVAQEILRNRDFTEIIFELISQLQGKIAYLNFVVEKMQKLDVNDEKRFWSKLQIYLFSLDDAVKDIPQINNSAFSILSSYKELMQSSPQNVPLCVRRSFFEVFRGLSTSTIKNNDFLHSTMCFSISQFQEPLVVHSAEKAFQKACQQYKHIAIDVFKQFGSVIEQYPERCYVVRGIFTLICSQQILLKQFYKNALNYLFSKFQKETEKTKRKELVHSIIQGLKTFKQSPLSESHIYLVIQCLKQNWSYLIESLSYPKRVKDDEDSDVEKIVRILKVAMRTLEFHFSEFLEEMFTSVLSAFSKYPICSYVYLVEVTVTIFSANSAYNDYLRRLYSDFCDIAFNHMNKIQDIGRFSYLLDDYMGMNKRFFVHNASTILSSGKLPSIIELTINYFMGCDVPRIAKAAYSFFETIFMVYWTPQHLNHRNSKEDVTPIHLKPEDAQYYQALKQFLLQKLDQIVAKMLDHLSKAPTEQTRDYILDALLSQIKAFIPENPAVWGHLLNQVSSQILVQQQKQRMVETLESIKGSSFQQSRKLIRSFDKMLVLMNRRMNNAQDRKNILI